METRIYEITDSEIPKPTEDNRPLVKPRLIEAANQAQALRFATVNRFVVEVASAKRVGELVGAGTKIEKAVKAEVKS